MKTSILNPIAIASIIALASAPAAAETFSYTFISANYSMFNEDIDGVPEDLEGNGISVSGKFNVLNNFGILASYGTGSADVTSSGITLDADISTTSIGVFFHTPVSNTVDFVLGAGIIRGNVDMEINGSPLPSEDADGNAIIAGIRAMASDKVEIDVFIDRTKIESDSSTDISFDASYYVDKIFTIDAGYSFDSDGSSISFGATKYF